MNKEDQKKAIVDIYKYRTVNQPFAVDIDICPDTEYWETGMKTKFNGMDVEILHCLHTDEYSKIIDEKDGIHETEPRQIDTLLIRELCKK